MMFKFSDLSNLSVRQKSLGYDEFAGELAELGACANRREPNKVFCYKCGLTFNVQEILTLKERGVLNFLEAGWHIHAKHHPWCELLEQVHSSTLDNIIGKIRVNIFDSI